MRIRSLAAAALSLVCLLIPAELPAQRTAQDYLVRWTAGLRRQDEALHRQAWKQVAKDAPGLIGEMVNGLVTGEGAAQMLAQAVAQQAVAESGLGHREEAAWLWHLAQNLDPRHRPLLLAGYGPPGEEMARLTLRQPGQAPAGGPQLLAEGSSEPPRAIHRKEPATPFGLSSARIAEDVEVELVIGADGRLIEPVLLAEPKYPSLAYVALESLRGWRFAPARAGGEAVPGLLRVQVSNVGLRRAVAQAPPAEWRSPESLRVEQAVNERRLADLDARLRRGAWQEAFAEARELVTRLREVGPENGPLAEGLRALALAEAGLGRTEDAVWHWQVARNLQQRLELDAAAYGEAGRLLARHELRSADEPPPGLGAVAVSALGAGATPPRKIAGDEPAVTGFLTSPRIPKWVRLQVVIDEQGRVVAPIARAGRPDALVWAALEAVRTWRFEPARRGGTPVATILDLTLPERRETPLAAALPLTGDLAPVHELLLARQWTKARDKADRLIRKLADEIDDEPRKAAAALAFLALAEAGSGDTDAVCHWQAALSFDSDLYHAGLAAYGPAGALLEASQPWLQPFGEASAADAPDQPVQRPEKISGRPPVYTSAARYAGVTGTVVVESIVGEDGRVYQPRVLKDLPVGLGLNALSAICEWRFKPATLGGKPVKVYYTLTVSFEIRR